MHHRQPTTPPGPAPAPLTALSTCKIRRWEKQNGKKFLPTLSRNFLLGFHSRGSGIGEAEPDGSVVASEMSLFSPGDRGSPGSQDLLHCTPKGKVDKVCLVDFDYPTPVPPSLFAHLFSLFWLVPLLLEGLAWGPAGRSLGAPFLSSGP